jgi:prophage regulatory protein
MRIRAVEEATGLKKSAIYAGMEEGTFPRQVPLGERAVAWLQDEIEAWIAARIAARDAKAKAKREPLSKPPKAAAKPVEKGSPTGRTRPTLPRAPQRRPRPLLAD